MVVSPNFNWHLFVTFSNKIFLIELPEKIRTRNQRFVSLLFSKDPGEFYYVTIQHSHNCRNTALPVHRNWPTSTPWIKNRWNMQNVQTSRFGCRTRAEPTFAFRKMHFLGRVKCNNRQNTPLLILIKFTWNDERFVGTACDETPRHCYCLYVGDAFNNTNTHFSTEFHPRWDRFWDAPHAHAAWTAHCSLHWLIKTGAEFWCALAPPGDVDGGRFGSDEDRIRVELW